MVPGDANKAGSTPLIPFSRTVPRVHIFPRTWSRDLPRQRINQNLYPAKSNIALGGYRRDISGYPPFLFWWQLQIAGYIERSRVDETISTVTSTTKAASPNVNLRTLLNYRRASITPVKLNLK